MRKTIKKAVAMMAAFGLAITAFSGLALNANAQEGTIEIYRIKNINTGEYLFTSDKNEVKVLDGMEDWSSEGVKWIAPNEGTPVYRLFLPGGFHLYTSDENEVKVLTGERGWLSDNDGMPVFYSGGEVPVMRNYNEETKVHVLTADQAEYDANVNNGWNAEGTKFYAVSKPVVKASDYIGSWYCGRAALEVVESPETSQYIFLIHWGNSAFESYEWMYPCTFDEENGIMECEGTAVKRSLLYEDEAAKPKETVFYDEGSGRFVMSGNGILWEDDNEDAGADMVFEKAQ